MTILDDLPSFLDRDGWILLDDDHAYLLLNTDGYDYPIGIIEMHYRPDNHDICYGSCYWVQVGTPDDPRPVWQLVTLEPLHLEPSVGCGLCGSHGFIRDGKWVSA